MPDLRPKALSLSKKPEASKNKVTPSGDSFVPNQPISQRQQSIQDKTPIDPDDAQPRLNYFQLVTQQNPQPWASDSNKT